MTNDSRHQVELEFHPQNDIAFETATSGGQWIQLDPASHKEVLRLEKRVSIHHWEFIIVLIAMLAICRGLLKRIEKLEKKGGTK